MREIKFRAWDVENKQMIDADSLAFGYYEPLCDQLRDNDEMNFMQYTGLKDKNGVEIYEGDIVDWQAGLVRGKDIIIYSDGSYVIDSAFQDDMSIYQDYTSKALEVIGNIHQNLELIKDSK